KREDQQDGSDSQVIENAFAENSDGEHREDALVSGPAGHCGDDSVGFDEVGNSGKKHGENENDHGKSALGVFDGRLAKSLHAVADRLHSSERRATGGENLQEQPVADGFARGGGRRKRRQRHGMSAAAPYGNQAGANDDQDGSNKKIRRHHEGDARFAEAAKIDDSDHKKNAKTKRQRVGCKEGTAEISAPTPAEIPTAAVRI